MPEGTEAQGPSLPRIIAVVLAVGAASWGGLLLLVFGLSVLFPVPFGIGYVVWVGYAVRAVSCPALVFRRLVWGASILVQGSWLCLGLADGLVHAAQ